MSRLAVALLAITLLAACATLTKLDDRLDLKTFGEDFDDLCVVGKVKGDSARWLNSNQGAWKQHADYADPRQPAPIKKGDRLFNGDCSEVTKRLGAGDLAGALEALGAVADGGG